MGVVLGLAISAFPGLDGIAELAIVIPFVSWIDTVSALASLVAKLVAIPVCDTFTSMLVGIPRSGAMAVRLGSMVLLSIDAGPVIVSGELYELNLLSRLNVELVAN